jgi:hypothetical protein
MAAELVEDLLTHTQAQPEQLIQEVEVGVGATASHPIHLVRVALE